MQAPEDHLGALIAAYEDASREDRALCDPSVRVKVNRGALAAADLIRARDAEVAAKAWSEGFATGQSRAMRHMSDEPLLPLSAPNPYEKSE